MIEVIVVCRCSGVREKAETGFKIAFPDKELPQIYRGQDAIRGLASAHSDTNLGRYLQAIVKKSGQFAYYLQSDNGDVLLNYDLLKGKAVA